MVSRIPAPADGSPRRPGRTTGAAALLIVLVVAVGTWLVNGPSSDPADSAVDPGETSAPSSPSAPATTSPSTVGESPRASASPTSEPTTLSTGATGAPPAGVDPGSGLPTVYLLDLPPEAAETVGAIDRGPPFPHTKDGSTFGNYEGLLPDDERGHYQEFTVETPGASDRGARRIVEGAGGELYWTDDHYASFALILL